MPSLHRQPNRPCWFCAFTNFDGKRVFRSTKIKASERTRSQAMALCEKWQRQAAQLSQGTKLENKEVVMETFINATKKAEKGEFTEATARQILNQLLEATGQAPMQLATTDEYLREWAKSKEVTKAKGTAQRYQHTVEHFIKHLGNKAKSSLGALVPRDIETFRDAQVKDGKSAATANMVVKTLRIPLNLARKQGIILTNPAEAVEMLQKQGASRETFTLGQLKSLLEVADSEWKGMILLGACAGMRIGDAARLTWKEVDLPDKVIRYLPQKTTQHRGLKPLEVIILPDLENYLLHLPVKGQKADAPLFPSLHKKTVSGASGLSAQFIDLLQKAGINREAVGRKVKGKGRQFFDLGFHSLRHTYISLMANAGVSRELRMKLAGHTSEAHDRYTHFERETMHEKLSAFPRILKN